MRQLVLTCALALLGGGCVEVVSHIDDFDAGPDVKPSDASGEAETSSGVCASGSYWTGGTTPSAVHYPGRACMGSGCHTSTTKTPMTMGGTIYPLNGPHDDNDCNGIDGNGAAIAIFDGTGTELPPRILVNASGNFYSNRNFPANYTVKLLYMNREAPQKSPITNGDCNYCHRPDNFMGAMGRIIPAPVN